MTRTSGRASATALALLLVLGACSSGGGNSARGSAGSSSSSNNAAASTTDENTAVPGKTTFGPDDDDAIIRKAVFKVKLAGEKRTRTVSIRSGNQAGYQRSEECMLVKQWLWARGFILLGTKAYAEAA